MARPLSTQDAPRGGSNGRPSSSTDIAVTDLEAAKRAKARPEFVLDQLQENDRLRGENAELRALCFELEQALQEASQQEQGGGSDAAVRMREYESLLEEKTETIRNLHQQLQETQANLQDAEAQAAQAAQAPTVSRHTGPVPREEELLALSEELERERRQLQEDEQALMEQMREMEIGMAKERAEMARQRNDLQRLQGEIRHELERLEKNGAMQSKIDGLKNRLQDATTRRGAAHATTTNSAAQPVNQVQQPEADLPSQKNSLMGRLFGRK
jgi:chromosome segregation ATPase